MTRPHRITALAVLLFTSLVVSCGGLRLQPIPALPTLAAADANIQVIAKKAVDLLEQTSVVTLDVSRAEAKLYADHVIPDDRHRQFRTGIVALSRLGQDAVNRFQKGIDSWAQARDAINPILFQLNQLMTLVQSTGGRVKAALSGILVGIANAWAEQHFGGAL